MYVGIRVQIAYKVNEDAGEYGEERTGVPDVEVDHPPNVYPLRIKLPTPGNVIPEPPVVNVDALGTVPLVLLFPLKVTV